MAFLEAVRLALQTIRAQKLKSAFSIIGVFIGVMFLIAVVSVVQGMNRYMTDKFAGTILGVNTFRLRQFPDVQLGNVTDSTWRVWRRRPRVSYEDAQAVMRGVTVPVLAAWESSTRTTLVAGRKQAKDVEVTAATELYFDIRALPVEQGRPFTGQEVQAGVPVLVPQHEHGYSGLNFLSRKGAALLDGESTDVEVELGRRGDLHILCLLAPGHERGAGARLPRGEHRDRHAAHHGLRIFVAHSRSAAPHPPRRIGDVPELHVGELPQTERVHAEDRAGELVGHVAVHPLHDRHDGDEKHHADEHADDREGALELLRPDGLQGEADGLEEGHLFVPERLDRIEPRGLSRGKDPEQEAGEGCQAEGEDHGTDGYIRRHRRSLGEDQRHEPADRHADNATHQRQRRRFDQELPQDLASRGAQRLTHPDLACALRDRDHHDRDHADAPHEQADHGEDDHQDAGYQREAVDRLDVHVLRNRVEVVFLAGPKPPLLAHRHRHVVDGALHGHRVLRHHEHVHPAGEVRQILGEGAVRNHHFGAVAGAEQARRGVIDPDHVIRHAAELDAPRDGVALAEQVLGAWCS